ncbi:sentrin-specific protease-like [Varroa jacobsoni]|uniref:sentrin-specific protease-like n=1 Tax=Varroa jacobsoni TaxID=62625 RepID=UPI000BF29CDB|nr:sentrin-specific protease-like [Varroa jacobsoni]
MKSLRLTNDSDADVESEVLNDLEQLNISETAGSGKGCSDHGCALVSLQQRFDINKIEKTAKKFRLNFNEGDLRSLTIPDEQLHDYAIDLYLQLVIGRANDDRLSNQELPKAYAFSSSFLYSYENYHYDVVKGAIDDLQKYDLLLFPVNENGVHWCLAVVHTGTWTIEYYDPLWNQKNETAHTDSVKKVNTIRDYLSEQMETQNMEYRTCSVHFIRDIPQQQNSYDCGVFVCKYAECIVLRKEMRFEQKQMSQFRSQIARDMENGALGS